MAPSYMANSSPVDTHTVNPKSTRNCTPSPTSCIRSSTPARSARGPRMSASGGRPVRRRPGPFLHPLACTTVCPRRAKGTPPANPIGLPASVCSVGGTNDRGLGMGVHPVGGVDLDIGDPLRAVVSASVNSVLVKAPAMHAVPSVMSCNTVRVTWRVCFDMNQYALIEPRLRPAASSALSTAGQRVDPSPPVQVATYGPVYVFPPRPSP